MAVAAAAPAAAVAAVRAVPAGAARVVVREVTGVAGDLAALEVPPVPQTPTKIGPGGVGTNGYVADESLLPYRINFENDATATAPAQFVTITDELADTLDWTTFRLEQVGFGDHFINVSDSRLGFASTVPITVNGQQVEVQVDVRLSALTGLLFAAS